MGKSNKIEKTELMGEVQHQLRMAMDCLSRAQNRLGELQTNVGWDYVKDQVKKGRGAVLELTTLIEALSK